MDADSNQVIDKDGDNQNHYKFRLPPGIEKEARQQQDCIAKFFFYYEINSKSSR